LDLSALGWDDGFAASFASLARGGELLPARVASDRGGVFELLAPGGSLRGEVSGRLQYLAAGPQDLPAVGDWVAAAPRPGEAAAIVHHVLPRRTALVRKAAGNAARAQLLAANVDAVLLVTSANRDFNPRRLERALAVVGESGARALLVLSKTDLCEDLPAIEAEARRAAPGVPVLPLSAATGRGLEALAPHLAPARTLVMLGSSGVGKSTLANRLLGSDALATRAIRADDDRGRHATTHRQLVVLPGGALLIDTPGLREIALFEEGEGLAGAFPELEALAAACRFTDCAHAGEPGCAVQAALDDGSLDPARLESFRKLEREAAAVRARRDARARHEQRQQGKRFERMRRRLPDKRDPRS
jgi:ribosome biogenesis GTPase